MSVKTIRRIAPLACSGICGDREGERERGNESERERERESESERESERARERSRQREREREDAVRNVVQHPEEFLCGSVTKNWVEYP